LTVLITYFFSFVYPHSSLTCSGVCRRKPV
jgi:hypothetical protein